MKSIALFPAVALLLAGCASTWYQAPSGAPQAKLRVVALAPGNTFMVKTSKVGCPSSSMGSLVEEGDQLLGKFNPIASDRFLAATRGYDRRAGMPMDARHPQHQFAEYAVQAEVPLPVRGTNLTGATWANAAYCHAVGSVRLERGRHYELLFEGAGPQCTLSLSEVVQGADGLVRRPVPFVDGPRNCRFGG
jgi:hypothetical protein